MLATALFSSPVLAAKNVGNTSQKGSLLIFPAIDVNPEDASDTLIEISNDNILPVQLECYYVNERKDRVDFGFLLTPKATASWDVGTGDGTINPPPFPSGGSFPTGNPNRGELICFAVDFAVANQVAFNHLTGTATVLHLDDSDAAEAYQALRYNAWAFAAEGGYTPPNDYTIMGKPGDLLLTGNGAGTYDACPLYNIASFMPGEGAAGYPTGSRLDNVYTIDNDLSLVSCNQDLRQDFLLHLTKLQFTVWNSNENMYTGAYVCVDSVEKVGLGGEDAPLGFVASSNFSWPTLRTTNARLQVQGVASTQCSGSENAGLIGVLTSSVELGADIGSGESAELGSTTQGAGAQSGFVLWDATQGGPPPQRPTH